MADIKTIFGLVLKKTRKEKGISQEQLAFDSGLDRSYISKLEVGSYQPSISTIFAIAEVLEVRPDELVSQVYERHMKPSSKKRDWIFINKMTTMPWGEFVLLQARSRSVLLYSNSLPLKSLSIDKVYI